MREGLVGLVNGLAFAVITGVAAVVWFNIPALGVVIGLAIICNLVAGALGGILIPMVLERVPRRPGGGVGHVRDHHHRRGRLLFVSRHRDVVVRPEIDEGMPLQVYR